MHCRCEKLEKESKFYITITFLDLIEKKCLTPSEVKESLILFIQKDLKEKIHFYEPIVFSLLNFYDFFIKEKPELLNTPFLEIFDFLF